MTEKESLNFELGRLEEHINVARRSYLARGFRAKELIALTDAVLSLRSIVSALVNKDEEHCGRVL